MTMNMRNKGNVPGVSPTALGWWLLALVAGMLALIPGSGWTRAFPDAGEVTFVCDGDTIILETGERVRYLGIDAPEIAHDKAKADCFGEEARKVNSDMVLHKRVSLQYDHEKTDPHGRLLAYVILPNGKCANAEMLRTGSALVYRPAQDLRRLQEFLLLQKEAIRQHQGMWGACPVTPERSYTGNHASFVFHRPECSLGRKIAVRQRVSFADRWAGLDQGYRPCRYCKP
jgi:micrococcal nuclease